MYPHQSFGVSCDFFSQSAEPIYLHVIRPLLKPYVSTLDAVLGFVHNLGDFVLLILSLPFTAAISWWYGPSTDEDQTGLTEADSESVRSYGDEQPATFRNRSDYPGHPISGRAQHRQQEMAMIIIHVGRPRGQEILPTRYAPDSMQLRMHHRKIIKSGILLRHLMKSQATVDIMSRQLTCQSHISLNQR
jgi:hypothetical protein